MENSIGWFHVRGCKSLSQTPLLYDMVNVYEYTQGELISG